MTARYLVGAVALALALEAACGYDAPGDGSGAHCQPGEVLVRPAGSDWAYCVPRIAVQVSPDGGAHD